MCEVSLFLYFCWNSILLQLFNILQLNNTNNQIGKMDHCLNKQPNSFKNEKLSYILELLLKSGLNLKCKYFYYYYLLFESF